MLATEPDSAHPQERAETSSLLETWSGNEKMRHIPPAVWIARKLDGDVRRRAERLHGAFSNLSPSDDRHAGIEGAFHALCRALERVCEVSRRQRGALHPPADLAPKLQWLITQAVANLDNAEDTFGRRFPFQTFERSSAEPLWAAVLTVLDRLDGVTGLVREIEPDIDERLLDGLVALTEPLRREPMA